MIFRVHERLRINRLPESFFWQTQDFFLRLTICKTFQKHPIKSSAIANRRLTTIFSPNLCCSITSKDPGVGGRTTLSSSSFSKEDSNSPKENSNCRLQADRSGSKFSAVRVKLAVSRASLLAVSEKSCILSLSHSSSCFRRALRTPLGSSFRLMHSEKLVFSIHQVCVR